MGYQALLFCPDEKLARVVSQVFSELDFSIDAVHEPFAAVKKLMAQRYDAIVVDCENEQNASLLFKSARNSTSNQSSLAIALVEGQAGVAKSYRIGANLVLTKPINVEQAKGTLRVARGLLRKNLDAAGASSPAASIATAKSSETAAPKRPDGASPAAAQPEPKQVVPEITPAVFIPPVPAVADTVMVASAALAEESHAVVLKETSPAEPAVPTVTHSPSATSSRQASAAAVAPAKESPAMQSQSKSKEAESAHAFHEAQHSAPEFAAYESAPVAGKANAPTISHTPTFGAIDEAELNASQGSKKFLVASAVIVLAVLGYFGYQKFGTETATPASPTSQRVVTQEPAQTPLAKSEPVAQPAATASSAATSVTSPTNPNSHGNAAAKNSAAKSAAAPDKPTGSTTNAPKISESSDDAPLKFAAPAPVHVKPGLSSTRRAEDVAAPSIAVATPNDSQLSGLMASATPTLPKPSLGSVRISQGVSQGLLIKRVPPQYPAAAKATHTQGEVRIEATINKEGMVVDPKVLRGDAILAHAAVEAVRQWRYKPYYLDGQPVEIQTEITINFKAD